MKKLIFFILIFSFLDSKSQSIDAMVNSTIDSKIAKFALTLPTDSVISAIRNDGLVFNIDTIYIPLNTSVIFTINLSCENTATNEIGRAGKKIIVRNLKGVYKLYNMGDYPVYSGEGTVAKAAWNIVQLGNFVVVQCTDLKGINIAWQVTLKPEYPQSL